MPPNRAAAACAHHAGRVWGTLVEMEPQDHLGYSNDYWPDVSGRGLGKAARGSSVEHAPVRDEGDDAVLAVALLTQRRDDMRA